MRGGLGFVFYSNLVLRRHEVFETVYLPTNFTDFGLDEIDLELDILHKMHNIFSLSQSTDKIDLFAAKKSLKTKPCLHRTIDLQPLKCLYVETFNC